MTETCYLSLQDWIVTLGQVALAGFLLLGLAKWHQRTLAKDEADPIKRIRVWVFMMMSLASGLTLILLSAGLLIVFMLNSGRLTGHC